MLQLVSATNAAQLRSATADARGLYAIDSVPEGTYLLGFFHPRLDSLGIQLPLTRVDVRVSGDVSASLGIPSARTLIENTCGPTIARDSLGVFMGTVRSARGEPLTEPGRVRAQWVEVTLGAGGIERRRPATTVNTTPSGRFAICGTPTEGTFLVRAFASADSSGFVELNAEANGLLVRDVYVGASVKTTAKGSANARIPVLRGTGALRGTVRGADGIPVRGARLVVWGSGLEDSTGAGGQYELSQLPAGTYTLEARALGFLPKRLAVDVPETSVGALDITMDSFLATMDTVRVRADRDPRMTGLAQFEERRKLGGGYFIDEVQLNRRNPIFMSDMLRTTPGVTIQPAGDVGIGDRIYMRGLAGSGDCIPAVWVNGLLTLSSDGAIDQYVNPQTVRAVELYTRPGSAPLQYRSANGCGSILIWTGYRKPTPR